MTVLLTTFAASEATMRWREPFVTEGLNKKQAVAVSDGIYRGFHLAGTGGGDRQMTITPDAVAGDNVAVCRTATGYALTVRRVGSMALDLTAYANIEVVIALVASYAVGATTSVQILAYTVAEWDALSDLDRAARVALGSVLVPGAATPISGTDFNNRRVGAWTRVAPEAMRWNQVLANGSFKQTAQTLSDGMTQGWNLAYNGIATGPRWQVRSTAPRTGNWALELDMLSATTNQALAKQLLWSPVQTGQRVRIQFYYKIINTLTGGTANVTCQLRFVSGAGTTDDATALVLSSFGAVSPDWVLVDKTIEVPALGGDLTTILKELRVNVTDANSTWSGTPAIRFDDFRVWVEAADVLDPEAETDQAGIPRLISRLEYAADDTFLTDRPDQSLVEEPLVYTGPGTSVPVLASIGLRAKRMDDSDASINQPFYELSGGIDLGGGFGVGAPITRAQVPRILTRALSADAYTLVHYSRVTGGTSGHGRIYQSSTGALSKTHNCWWDNTAAAWKPDVPGVSASRQLLEYNNSKLFTKMPNLPASWTVWDAVHTQATVLDGGNKVPLFSMTGDDLPATSTPSANTLYQNNTVKAWGRFTTAGGVVTWIDSFNVDRAASAVVIIGTLVRINLLTAFANSTYVPVPQYAQPLSYYVPQMIINSARIPSSFGGSLTGATSTINDTSSIEPARSLAIIVTSTSP